jgi:hypothetical protein
MLLYYCYRSFNYCIVCGNNGNKLDLYFLKSIVVLGQSFNNYLFANNFSIRIYTRTLVLDPAVCKTLGNNPSIIDKITISWSIVN